MFWYSGLGFYLHWLSKGLVFISFGVSPGLGFICGGIIYEVSLVLALLGFRFLLESLHTRSPFSTKKDIRCFVAVCFAVGLQRVRPSATENAIPHMIAELWLRTPLH